MKNTYVQPRKWIILYSGTGNYSKPQILHSSIHVNTFGFVLQCNLSVQGTTECRPVHSQV